MPVIFNEKMKCKNCSNEFEWLCYFLRDGEFINRLRKNVKRSEAINGSYFITVECPNCNSLETIKKQKLK